MATSRFGGFQSGSFLIGVVEVAAAGSACYYKHKQEGG
jgi:hypothetical protein